MKAGSRWGSHPAWLLGPRRGISLAASKCKGIQSTGLGGPDTGFQLELRLTGQVTLENLPFGGPSSLSVHASVLSPKGASGQGQCSAWYWDLGCAWDADVTSHSAKCLGVTPESCNLKSQVWVTPRNQAGDL